jgi:hypothetical protein
MRALSISILGGILQIASIFGIVYSGHDNAFPNAKLVLALGYAICLLVILWFVSSFPTLRQSSLFCLYLSVIWIASYQSIGRLAHPGLVKDTDLGSFGTFAGILPLTLLLFGFYFGLAVLIRRFRKVSLQSRTAGN